jgi:phosphatidylinositol alpha 1,6-mannosyltransferase
MSRSVDVARCDHEGRDHHRVLPTRRQRCRPLRAACRRTPRQRRPPPARYRPPPATGQTGRENLLPVPRGAGARGPAARLPGLPARPLGRRVWAALIQAELVHLAAWPSWGARRRRGPALGLPTVAVYRTDLPSYARVTVRRAARAFAWRWLRGIHNGAVRTLARPRSPRPACSARGSRTSGCGDAARTAKRFHSRQRSPQIRAEVALGGELIAGYVGRPATEKRVDPGRDHRADGVRWSSAPGG